MLSLIIIIILFIFSISFYSQKSCLVYENKENFEEKELILLAYQLEGFLRSSYKTAYNSWLNLDRVAEDTQEGFLQIINIFRKSLFSFVSETEINYYIKRLKNINIGGEGETTFPTHEVINKAKIISQSNEKAQIEFVVTRYYPATEWEGERYQQEYKYVVTLIKEYGKWKLEEVIY